MYYAYLNKQNVCTAIIEGDAIVKADNLVALDGHNDSLIGMTYGDGSWATIYHPTAEELHQAANLLNQAEILANQRQQDKVMAAILLEQVGGEANV